MSGLHHFPEEGIPFQVEAPYSPMGDQPKAIESLAEGIEQGEWAQVLLGATGTGKTYTMAKLIEAVQKRKGMNPQLIQVLNELSI